MSVSVAHAVPVVASEVPLLSGDIMREIKTLAVSLPLDPVSHPPAARVSNPENTTVVNALATRRLSAGAVIAGQIGIDLNAIGKVEARKIMSAEHKVLGFRPPPGSLAAEAQAAAAKHPEVKGVQAPDPEKLKEAAKVDAERILAERVKNEKEGDNGVTKSAGINGDNGSEPAIDLSKITEEEARRLMSHEHRALGFRPPPGSLAAEAQAAAAKFAESNGKPRRNSNDTGRKSQQNSTDANVKPRRGSGESRGKPRQNSVSTNGSGNGNARARSARRGSNENGKPRRGSGEQTNDQSSENTNGVGAARRRSSAAAPTNNEDLLREAARLDAERIKAVRGVNGAQASEHAHADVRNIAAEERKRETINLPAPAQQNVDRGAKHDVAYRDAVAARAPVMGNEGQDADDDDIIMETEVAPGELEHEENMTPSMVRTETTDSVQIIGDVLP